MAFILDDRVRETSTSAGTGDLTLNGTLEGFRTFDSVLNSADTTWYCAVFGAEWEVGLGTFTAPATLTRTTVIRSSNGGSAVDFSAGTKDVFVTVPGSALEVLASLTTLGTAAQQDVGTGAGDVPQLDGSGKLPAGLLPAIALNDTFVVATQAAMLALTAERGDIAIRTDINKSFVLATDSPGTLADWKELLTPTDLVLSVAGLTGSISASALKTALSLTAADIGDASANGRSLIGAADYAAMRTLLGLVIGTDVQAVLAKAAGSDLRTGTDDAKYLTAKAIRDAFAFVALTDASTIAIDMAAGFNFSVTLGGSRTLGAPTNSIAGQSGLILITQDGTGSRTLSYNAAWKFAGGTPTASTAAGTVDAIAYTVTTGGGSPIIRATYIKGFA